MTDLQQVVASGWPCFPLRPHSKVPALPGAHPVGDPKRGVCKGQCRRPGHGVWDATTEIAVLQRWSRAHPGCNWGVHAGAAGLFIIDVDTKHGAQGVATWNAHAAQHGHVDTFTVRTPSGGWHFYYRLPEGLTVTTRSLLGDGVDVRATGGYVLLPGSYVDDGEVQGSYEVADPRAIAELPAWIVELYRSDAERIATTTRTPTGPLADTADVRARLYQLRDEISDLPEGDGANGSSRIAFMAGQYCGAGQADPDTVITVLTTGLDEWTWRRPSDRLKIEKQIAKGVHDGMREPRAWTATPERVAWFPGQDHLNPRPAPPQEERRERGFLDITDSGAALDALKAALGGPILPGLFLRNGRIVHTPRMGAEGYIPPSHPLADDGPAQVRVVEPDALGALVDHAYQVVQYTQGGKAKPRHLPSAFASRLLGAATVDLVPNLRPLHGVTHTPIVRADGSILDEPGYDAATKILYLPTIDGVKVPDEPTAADVAAALAIVRTPIAEFPFVTTTDEANWIGTALTPLLRTLVPQPYQLAIFDAPNPGSGKSYLLNILRVIHGVATRPSLPRTDEEWSKTVPSLLHTTTTPYVAFDNVRGLISSAYLEGLLTNGVVADRVLGKNTQSFSMVNDRMWIITANNATYGGDLARRVLRVVIDPGVPDPQTRTFRLNPVDWAREHRAEYLSALLTLIRAWTVAGQPMPALSRSDDYGRWIAVIRGILGHAGVEGLFAAPVREERSTDDEEWGDFLAALAEAFGYGQPFTARTVLERLEGTWAESTPEGYIPRDVIPAELATKVRAHVGSPEKSLGRWLTNRNGRWVNKHKVVLIGKPDTGPDKHRNQYMIERAL